MKKVLKLLIIISFTGLFLTACGGDGTDETNDDSENVTADNETADDEASGTDCPADNKFCHEHNGLNWTAISSEKIVWSKAVEDCQGLGGRLPTIAELRGLIEGCEKTVTGGSCAFTEGCLTNECLPDCFCNTKVEGYSVFGDVDWLWSSTPKDGDPNSACGVAFGNASIFCDSSTGWNYYRCVK